MNEKMRNNNLIDEIEQQLIDGKISLRHLELAYIGYMRRRKDLPEGVRNMLADKAIHPILRFSQKIMSSISSIELAYYRGQRGKEKI